MLLKLKNFLLKNQNPEQTIVKNIFWLSATQGSRVLRVITLIYAARILGAAEYGLFSYALGIMAVLSFLSDIGTDDILTREIAKNKDKGSNYFATVFWIRIVLVLITILVIIAAVPYVAKDESIGSLLYLTIFLVIFNNLQSLVLSYLRGLEKMEQEALIVTILNLAMALSGFFILTFKPSAQSLLIVYAFSGGMAFLVSIIVCWKIFKRISLDFNKTIAVQILKNCWPIVISGSLGIVTFNFDLVMLGWWRTSAEIGLYSAGQKIIQILYTLPTILATGIFPTLSLIINNGNSSKEKLINERSITIIFLFTFPIVAGGIVLSQSILNFVYGLEYAAGANAFRILLLDLCLIFPSMIISNLVLAHNQQKKFLKYAGIASSIDIGLNIVFIPVFGIIGAAISTLISQIVNYILTLNAIKKVSYFQIMPYLKKIIPSSIAVGLLSFILAEAGTHVVTNIILSGIFYLALLVFLKEKIIYRLLDISKIIRSQKPEKLPATINEF